MSEIFPTIRSYQKTPSPNTGNNTIDNIESSNKSRISPTSIGNNINSSSILTSPTSSIKNNNNFLPIQSFGGPCNICKVDKSPLWEESNGIVYCKNCFKKVVDNFSSSPLSSQLPSISYQNVRPPFGSGGSFENKPFKPLSFLTGNNQNQSILNSTQNIISPIKQQPYFKQNVDDDRIQFHQQLPHLPPQQQQQQKQQQQQQQKHHQQHHQQQHHHTNYNQQGQHVDQRHESYYCKYCEKNFPSTAFKNIQAFGAHCSNCSRKRKIRDDGFSFVPEMGNFEHHHPHHQQQQQQQQPFKFQKKMEDLEDHSSDNFINQIPLPPPSMNLGSDDIHKPPYSSPFSPQYENSSPLISPRGIINSSTPASTSGGMQIDDGSSLRFGLLDVIEDKLAEENELELIRRDLKNIGNEITIQDMKREKEIIVTGNSLSNDLKDTQSRMLEDINEKILQDENSFQKLKDDFILKYVKLENELSDLIDLKNKLKEEKRLVHDDHSDELKIDEDIHDSNTSSGGSSGSTNNSGSLEIKNENPSNGSSNKSSNSKIVNSNIIINKKEFQNEEKDQITSHQMDEDDQEIIKKIESIKKAMNESIMEINLMLSTQGRELERLVSLESNEYEKHYSKKLDDLKKDINENSDALVNSFVYLDTILLQSNHPIGSKKSFSSSNLLPIFN